MREEIRLGNEALAENDLEAAGRHFQQLLDDGGTPTQERIARNRLLEIRKKQSGRRAQHDKPTIELTPEAHTALQLFEETKQHVFLTGRAGTGKSTLLQHFRSTTRKRIVVLAPTGVAAVNVQGQTIHSFFGFGPGVTPEKAGRRATGKRQLYRKLQAIVIDEISMVRADLLDCIDAFLRLNGPRRSEPFGGVQLLCIGDLYQLPPVVRPEEETLFSSHYTSPYFFDARVFRQTPCEVVQLTKVYRQADAAFVTLLDAVRTGSLDRRQLAALNTRYCPDLSGLDRDTDVALVSTNAMAERINAHHLARLLQKPYTFTGRIDGTFHQSQLPTDATLTLKVGARIMMLNNEPGGKWVNGTLGQVAKIDADDESVAVHVRLENGHDDKILQYTWEAIRFGFNDRTQRIESEVVGSFTQYPLRLAWATTIHKAQGKTFDRVVIDLGRGAFAPGQVYVALSRCRTMQGLVLRQPLQLEHVWIDPRVQAFLETSAAPSQSSHPGQASA
ncbi:ATP-dependent RecD-like DNA helicase [Candidatus Entotheonellaceae bacterium PAL068K]